MSDDDSIRCGTHGNRRATYLCGHLAADPVQRWHGAHASTDNPWPDSWCDGCNAAFLRDGAWNDENSAGLDLKILCSGCYEHAKGRSVGRLRGASLANWNAFLDDCRAALTRKQDALEKRFQLWRHKRWDWDQDRAEIVFSNDGVPAVVATIAFVGSLSTRSNTWMWSWANESLAPAVVGEMARVRDDGEALDRPHLCVPTWPADEHDGWAMAAVAVHLLEADGAYRTPTDHGFLHMVLKDVRAAS
jgi:hypothetical protein